MPFSTERKNLDSGVVVLALTGTMTMADELQQLKSSVGDLMKNKHDRVIFDMSRVTYVDSSAIGVIVSCYLSARQSGGQLRVAGVCGRVLSVFRMVSIDRLLALDPTVDAADEAIGNSYSKPA